MDVARPQATSQNPEPELRTPREIIISTPDNAAIAQAVRAFLRVRLLRRARAQASQSERLSD